MSFIMKMSAVRKKALTPAEALLWAFAAALLAAFVVWPVGSVFAESFMKNGQFSLRAYEGLLTKNVRLVLDSFALALSVAALSVPVSVAVALRLVYGPSRGRSVIVAALALSTISPPFLCSMAYLMLFGKRGLITWRLLGMSWNPYGFHGVLMMEVLSLTGLTSLLVAASLDRVDGEVERASLDLGASPLATLMRVSLPLALPGIGAAALVVFVRSLSDFGTPLFVGGRFQVLASRAYNTLIGVGDFQLACAMNVLLLIPALAVLFVRSFGGKSTALGLARRRTLRLPPLAMAVPSAVAWTFAVMQFLVYGLIFLGSVTRTWGVDFTPTSRHLAGILDFRAESVIRSLACSLAAGLGGCLLASVLAFLLARAPRCVRRCVQVIADLPYLIPGTFFGVGYLLAFTRLPFELATGFVIGASCLFRQLSPVLRAAEAGLAQVDDSLWSAVRDLGGGPLRVLRDLLLPLLYPFLRLGFLNTFSAAMTTTGPVIFLVSPYARVASIELFEAINEGDFGGASAMGSLLVVIVACVNGLAWRLGRGRKEDGVSDARI